MSERTAIEWTDATWSPVTGCTRISEGCLRCYIERTPPMRMAGRRFDSDRIGATTGIQLHPERLDVPRRWRKPRRIFVCSMADLFYEGVPSEYIARVFAAMAAAPQHTFQVLTKRPHRMRHLIDDGGQNLLEATADEATAAALYNAPWPLPNVWLGTSVESQKWADIRIPQLLDTPAAVRYISAEPLLGPIDLDGPLDDSGAHRSRLTYWLTGRPGFADDGSLTTGPRLDWVIAGGESGPGARPMHPAWARSLRDQCTAAGVAFHFKQHGEWTGEHSEGDSWAWTKPRAWVSEQTGAVASEEVAIAAGGSWQAMYRVGKKRAGRELDGRIWDEFPAPPISQEVP